MRCHQHLVKRMMIVSVALVLSGLVEEMTVHLLNSNTISYDTYNIIEQSRTEDTQCYHRNGMSAYEHVCGWQKRRSFV